MLTITNLGSPLPRLRDVLSLCAALACGLAAFVTASLSAQEAAGTATDSLRHAQLVTSFRQAMGIGNGLIIRAPNGTPAANAVAWAGMARHGRPLVHECTPPSHSSEGHGPVASDSEARQLCAQLLTTYIATRQPTQVDRLAKQLKTRWHLPGERELQEWYAQQLSHWFGGGPAALNVVNTLLQQSSEAATIHQSLFLHAAQILANATPGARVYASPPQPIVWPSEPPPDNPLALSKDITGVEFSGTFANYGRADWWYTSWGADDVLYTTYAGGELDDSTGKRFYASVTATGRALVRGNDPLHLTLTPLPIVEAAGAPFSARFPSANLVYHGVWYVGTYTIDVLDGCADFCVLGPLVGFHWSTDQGRTWHAPPPSITPEHSVFGEAVTTPQQFKNGARVKLSAAHFVDFGKDMRYSPDGKAYLIGHGSAAPDSRSNWASGDQIYLARVTPSPEAINDVKAWEFYAGQDASGRPRWSTSFADIRPLVEWKDHLGHVTVTYDAPLKKYLMLTTHQHTPTLAGPFDTMVLEADRLTGPWRLVTYMKEFGPEAYSFTVPSKFISADGCTMWLSYTANFAFPQSRGNPFGSGYWMNLQKIRLLGPERCRGHRG